MCAGAKMDYAGVMTQLLSGLTEADALDLLRDERERALETLRLIEEEGWTHHEAEGFGDTIRDVTDKRANRQKQIIERMERLIGWFERRQD